jgi:hypothetical protein
MRHVFKPSPTALKSLSTSGATSGGGGSVSNGGDSNNDWKAICADATVVYLMNQVRGNGLGN